jgi:hypothetical protein
LFAVCPGFIIVAEDGEYGLIQGPLEGADLLTAAELTLPVYSLRRLYAYVRYGKTEFRAQAIISAETIANYLNSRISAFRPAAVSV